MLHSILSKKGMGLVEVLIAMVLTSIGILALLSLQPTGLRTMAQSDVLGRASGILYKTLETYETRIVNPCCPAPLMGAQAEQTIRVSGGAAGIDGDMAYTVNTTIFTDDDTIPVGKEAFVVQVTVTWPGNATGISESVSLTRNESHRFPSSALHTCENGANTDCEPI